MTIQQFWAAFPPVGVLLFVEVGQVINSLRDPFFYAGCGVYGA